LALDKWILQYTAVGALFLIAAGIFYFSKKLPAGIINEPMEKAGKARTNLIIMTLLVIICFIPVFASYNSDSAKRIEVLNTEIAAMTNSITTEPSRSEEHTSEL